MQPGIRYYAENTGSSDVGQLGLTSRRVGHVEIDNGQLDGKELKEN